MTDAAQVSPISAAMRDLVRWSEEAGLPLWQRDAMRRLYLNCPLPPDIEDELLQVCKKAFGLIEADDVPLPIPISNADVPSDDTMFASVTIASVSNAERVNALAPNQSLHLEEEGLTVVFGNNGSGKSGYARILKQVCRARGSEDILHNVYGDPPASPASAILKYSIGGNPQPPFNWINGVERPDVFSQVSVFDSKCASVHVDEKYEAAYTPLPLQIIKELSELSLRFKATFQEMLLAQERLCPRAIREPVGSATTKAGALLRSITADTEYDALEAVATLTVNEIEEIEQLSRQLSEDPRKIIPVYESKLRQLESLIARINALQLALGDANVDGFQNLLQEAAAKSDAAKLAATMAFGGEPLEGIGSDTWNALWNSARRFSETEAYPSTPFPNIADSLCVLCQQPLGEQAIDRFSRFEIFVKEDVQRSADEAVAKVKKARERIHAANIEPSNYRQDDFFLRQDIQSDELANQLTRFYRVCLVRRGRLIKAAVGEPPLNLIACDSNIVAALTAKRNDIEIQIENLRSAFRQEERERIARQLQELQDRKNLQNVLPEVKEEILRQRVLQRLNNAIVATDTSKLTRKSTSLADSLVTSAWRDQFASEVSRLGIHHLRIELQRERGAHGAARFRVVLVRDNSIKLGKVLSEGEFRCIALAAFLSELSTTASKSALVFDDPVSSLDHDHRELVAKRLAEEAASGRQVIVFTHDVFFLDWLTRYASISGAKVKFRTVSRVPDNSRSGVIENSIPSNVAPAETLAQGILAQVNQLAQAYENGHHVAWNDRVDSFSNQIRKCWERAVAEVVSPVVERFRVQVDTKNIWQLAALDEGDCDEMRRAYKRCSELIHEKCAELGRGVPTPSEYCQEIDVLVTWIGNVRAKQQDAQNNRPQT